MCSSDLEGGVRFCLPTPAASWAEAILNPKGRMQKLGVKAGQRVAVVGVDDAEFLSELHAQVAATPELEGLDLLFYGADSAEALARIGELAPSLAPRGALWVVSLKGKAARVRTSRSWRRSSPTVSSTPRYAPSRPLIRL